MNESIIDKKFGKLIVKSEFKKENGKIYCTCVCDCGNATTVVKNDIVRGHTSSCGCKAPPIENLTGRRFGKLTVISRSENRKGRAYWNCICDCGKSKTIYHTSLLFGYAMSCGCSKIERFSKVNIFENCDEYIQGYTSTNHIFFIDYEDFEKVKLYYWGSSNGYIINKKIGGLHRYVLGLSNNDNNVVDHINHIKHDNRKSNLRICTIQENNFNKIIPKNNASGNLGVFWNKFINKWVAYISIDKTQKVIGKYDNIEDAIIARKNAENKYYKEFVYKNKEDE